MFSDSPHKQTSIQITENTGKRDCDNCRQTSACNTKAKENGSLWWRVTLGNFLRLPQLFFSCYFRILERGSRRPREKSQSQLCWSISDSPRALLVRFWFWFLWRFIFSLDSLFSWPVTSESIWFLFSWWRGTCCPVVRWNPHPHRHVQMCCARLPRHKYSNYTSKVNHTEDFQMSPKWKPESRILNNALTVYCLLNQRTQIA